MSNTITAYFKGRVGVAESVYQNDYGIVMAFDSIDLPAHFDCYFSRLNQEEALPGLGADNRVTIPNSILANPGNVTIHIPLHTGEDDSEVEYVVYFKVIGRARPIDDGTPTQMTAIERALALLSQPITNIEEIVNEALSFTGDTFAEMKQDLQDDFDNYTETLEGDLTTWKGGVESDIDDVEADFAVLQGQFDTAVAAVTTDTEVTDIRVGADGVTDTTAGASVRRQFTDVKSALSLKINDRNKLNLNSATTQTISDVTFTPHFTNGLLDYINVNGTASAKADYDVLSGAEIPAGSYKISSFYDDNGEAVAYTNVRTAYYNNDIGFEKNVNSNNVAEGTLDSSANLTFRIQVLSGDTVNNIKVYPLIRLSADADASYVPYKFYVPVQEQIDALDTKVGEIDGIKDNLDAVNDDLRFNIINPLIGTQSLTGIDLTKYNDGTYKVNGLASANTKFRLFGIQKYPCDIPKGKYKFTCTPSSGSALTYYAEIDLWDENETLLQGAYDTGSGFTANLTADAKYINVEIYIISGTTVSNAIYKPMLTTDLNATYDDYVQYVDNGLNLQDNLRIIENKLNNNKLKTDMLAEDMLTPYWTLHLDCGRKYISPENIETMIDSMETAGMNQLQLHFSDDNGFRFALDDMTIVDEDGTSYDLTSCLGGSESPTKWFTQTEMDNLIAYARGKGINVVPSLDMPGHMGRILSIFTQFKYGTTNSLDIANPTAVKFARAIASKYTKYFVSRGCKIYHFGFDEFGGGHGLEDFYDDDDFVKVTDFANGMIKLVKDNGLQPRMYQDACFYEKDYTNYISKDAEICVWTIPNASAPTSDDLITFGYRCINMSSHYYWVLGSPSYQVNVTPEYLRAVNNLLTDFVSPTNQKGIGAVLSVWCDLATTVDVGDEGDSIVTAVVPLIEAFGDAIENTMNNLN